MSLLQAKEQLLLSNLHSIHKFDKDNVTEPFMLIACLAYSKKLPDLNKLYGKVEQLEVS
jgi:hypothetical protein